MALGLASSVCQYRMPPCILNVPAHQQRAPWLWQCAQGCAAPSRSRSAPAAPLLTQRPACPVLVQSSSPYARAHPSMSASCSRAPPPPDYSHARHATPCHQHMPLRPARLNMPRSQDDAGLRFLCRTRCLSPPKAAG
eukprot:1147496-Pelagomonas_calceolata.AAC.5